MKDDERPPILTDEHIPPHLGAHLSKLGYDVLTVRQTNKSKSGDADPDSKVLETAASSGRVVITNNRADFEALHASSHGNHFGIVICPVELDADLRKQAKMIDAAIEAHGGISGMRGSLVHIKTVHSHRRTARENRRRHRP
jgi:predicted nuclease of predicted toxin-antitoxin system